MRDAWRHFAAEFVGIFGLVFIGGGAIMSAAQQQINPLVPAAIAHGLILAIMVTATMRISGHLNPAVTIGFLVTKRIDPMMAVLYIIAQLLGATLAAYALKAIFPEAIAIATRLGGQSVAGDIGTELGIPASTLSHHLEKLKNEELVTVERRSTFLWYRANTETLQELLTFLYAECCTRNQAVRPETILKVCR